MVNLDRKALSGFVEIDETPSGSKALKRAASASPPSTTSPPPACTASSAPTSPPRRTAGRQPARNAGRAPRRLCRRHHGRPCGPALGSASIFQPQNLGARHLPRSAPQAPAILPRRVRVPLQPPPLPPCRFPIPPRNRHAGEIRHLQDVDPTGSSGITIVLAMAFKLT